jgi:ABC-type uncharacterized transport system substrate-binding protein
MWFVVKRLSRGLLLIAAASGILLASDVRRSSEQGHKPRIAILQHASTATLDDGVHGMIEGLAETGYRDGDTAVITLYNAEGEAAMANMIAQKITNGSYDLVVTSSTPSLQAVANVNRAGRVQHVFGLVADPCVAGVGLERGNPLAHPCHLVGYGLLLPAGGAFRIAKRMLPALRTVGVPWNPAEPNSLAFLELARAVCKELSITLVEAPIENSSGVQEAVKSLIGRDIQAIWISGDVAVASATDAVIATARQARIPVFSILPAKPDRGTLFDLGLDFHAAGRLTGELAGQILNGADPTTIPIRDAMNMVPRYLSVNVKALKGLKDPWRAPPDLLDDANVVVDDTGVHRKDQAKASPERKP